MSTKIIGITGTISSGKSLVGKLLEEFRVTVLDTDHIAHYVQAHDETVRAALRERFGGEIFSSIGDLDRKKLGAVVFNNKEAMKDLNNIIHPAILRECRKRVAEHDGEPLVALLVPLLFEAGIQNQYDEIWTVTARDAVVRERLKARDGISDEEVDKRLSAQFSQEEKIARSNFVIDNSGTADDTKAQVLKLLRRFEI